jgi:predicted nucleic acid-binding protein
VPADPKFRLSAAEREELLADYLPWVEVVRIPVPPPVARACRDPADLPFLHLAAAGRGRVLVSGDLDLLALERVSNACLVVDLSVFRTRFLDR